MQDLLLQVYINFFSVILGSRNRTPSERSLSQMDKNKVITAYRRGFLTVRECGQILGIEELQLQSLLAAEESRTGKLPPAPDDRRLGTGS